MNIYDIAKEAGVAIATISRVINGHSNFIEFFYIHLQFRVLKVSPLFFL